MARILRLVLDVVKLLEPSIIEIAEKLAELPGVDGVNIGVIEIDKKVENVRITIEGQDIPVEKVFNLLDKFGAAVHSIDEVIAGKRLVEHAITLEEEV